MTALGATSHEEISVTKFLISTTALAWCLQPAWANESQNADIVVTATGFEQPRAETGQAISVIDRDRLDTLQVATIADAIATLPSVRVASRGGIGGQSSAFIRGGNSSQTLVLIDGVRINDPSSPNGAFDFGSLLTGNVDRVEVLRGPNSIIWGSQAIGGVVNVRSIVPTQSFAAQASAEYGRYDTGQVRANISGTSGILEGSVGGAYFSTGGISSLTSGTERDGYRNTAANGRLKVNLSDDFSLDLRGYYNRGRVEYDSPFGAGGDALPVSRNRQFIGYVGANARLFDGRLQSRLSYARTDIKRTGTDPEVDSFNNFDVAGTIDRFELHNSFDVAEAATLVFGIEHERTLASTSFLGAVADVARNHVTSGFSQVILRPISGVTLTGGVRYDHSSSYGGDTTLGGNIAYTPNSGRTVLRATYGEGFRAPTLSESKPPFGNPALKPETAVNFDFGVEHHFLGDKAVASATYYHRNSKDLISFSFFRFTTENIDAARAEGIELELNLSPVKELSVNAAYSLVNAKSLSDPTNGRRLPYRPKNSARLSVDWKSARGLSLGADVSLQGQSLDVFIDQDVPIFTPNGKIEGYTIVNVRSGFQISPGIEVYGRVENLFGAKYVVVPDYSTYGRNAHIGVRARF